MTAGIENVEEVKARIGSKDGILSMYVTSVSSVFIDLSHL